MKKYIIFLSLLCITCYSCNHYRPEDDEKQVVKQPVTNITDNDLLAVWVNMGANETDFGPWERTAFKNSLITGKDWQLGGFHISYYEMAKAADKLRELGYDLSVRQPLIEPEDQEVEHKP